MDELVRRLSLGDHPITVGGSKTSLEDLQRRLKEMRYVFIKFTETQGGTDLGVQVDEAATDLTQADFAQATGTVHIEGTLTLNYAKVRCIADLDIQTLKGSGHLVAMEG